ncbi:MAG TPA: hypothetical protein VHX17_12720 [Candidatus Cybelea sp.]|jgi:hypothetical protein|nr:hypothetical protein [Candidatus Cybelea sp.]
MANAPLSLARRSFLECLVMLPALAAALGGIAAADSSKASKIAMHYQSSPNGSMQCSGCKYFSPGSDANSDGSCQIVDGSISPTGYCMAYSAK